MAIDEKRRKRSIIAAIIVAVCAFGIGLVEAIEPEIVDGQPWTLIRGLGVIGFAVISITFTKIALKMIRSSNAASMVPPAS